MTCPSAAFPAPCRPAAAGLSRLAQLVLLGSITTSFLAGSAAPTPLYPVYQSLWGFSAATVTTVFASYVLVLLGALLVFGRLSDHIGRKPVILVATALQIVAMLLFATADGVGPLFAGRIVQGLATGAAIAAVGAGMLDLDRVRGTIANAVAPGLGSALGGVGSGLLVRYLPEPTHLVYGVLIAIFLLQGLGIALMPEPGQRRAGAWLSLRPQLGTPATARDALRMALPMLVAGWALVGFYGSLGPSLLHRVFGLDASLGGGIALFLLAGSGGVAVLVLRALEAPLLLRVGAIALSAGMAGVLWALATHSAAGFALAAVVAGAGFGSGFQGGVRSVLAKAAPSERAGLLSVVFLVSYLAMGLPAVIAGWLVMRTGNLPAIGLGFATVVFGLALLAWRGSAGGARAAV
jgi:MFS family permease